MQLGHLGANLFLSLSGIQLHQPTNPMTTVKHIRRDYIAIINGEESHPIEGIRAKNASDARKQARREMTDVCGWCKYDGKLTIKVRLA